MSGGTDSSVAAILLLEQGYEVMGITFRFWKEGENTHLNNAVQLAEQLGIQYITYDAREEFREKVVGYFVEEYLACRTPFPCVKCNNELKWKLILEEADRLSFLENGKAKVELAEPLESITPGQTALFCHEGKVLGGGFIS